MGYYRNNYTAFANHLMPVDDLLEKAIEWIKDNMGIDDVFDEKKVKEYIKDNFSQDEIFDMDDYLKNVDIVKTFSENDIRDAARQIGIIDIQEYRDNQIDKIV